MARRRDQTEMPGFERTKRPEIEEAAENYRVLRDQEIEVGQKAKDAKATLIEAMKIAGVTVHAYFDEDGNERKVVMETKENAKVKKVSSKGDDQPSTIEVS